MDAGTSLARQTRTKHRHELRALTYVTLDQANGGIVRNLTREGLAVQAVAAVHPMQEVRVRFELRYPKLRVEARGQVMWSTSSGQCGIRFVDLPPTLSRDIQQWIFGDLLEAAALHSNRAMFALPGLRESSPIEEDGLLTSATPVKVIGLPRPPDQVENNLAFGSFGRGNSRSTGLAFAASFRFRIGLGGERVGYGRRTFTLWGDLSVGDARDPKLVRRYNAGLPCSGALLGIFPPVRRL